MGSSGSISTTASTRLLRRAPADVRREVDTFLWAFRLERIRRFVGQPYWDDESLDARYADRIESFPRLETVAEHSWLVADAVLLFGWRFPYLSVGHAVKLAVLHDKMEIAIGDVNPLGRDGTGNNGHAFSKPRQAIKDERERVAIEAYLDRLSPQARPGQAALLYEALECKSPESRYVKGVDKMAALAFVLLKKRSDVQDKHLRFLLEFTDKNNRFFPPLTDHSNELLRRVVVANARRQGQTPAKLIERVRPGLQLDLLMDSDAADSAAADRAPPRESKKERLRRIFAELESLPPARTGVEASAQLAACINRIEDEVWGAEWQPPRFVPPGTTTNRLYPIAADSTFPVPNWRVDVLVAEQELVFISQAGAIEVQSKIEDDLLGESTPFSARGSRVLFEKVAVDGTAVWNEANRLGSTS